MRGVLNLRHLKDKQANLRIRGRVLGEQNDYLKGSALGQVCRVCARDPPDRMPRIQSDWQAS